LRDPVEVVEYDPEWVTEFERLRTRIEAALDSFSARVEHVGSTAVPGLAAKPIVDIDVIVGREDVDDAVERLAALGYRPAEYRLEIPDRHALAWPEGEKRHHVNICPIDSAELGRHLRFRDRLRQDPALARTYGDLKRELARAHRDDRVRYGELKTEFVERALGAG
jgi:GrpB-like predicted nucleotidyltransferase (UPF0157 family)